MSANDISSYFDTYNSYGLQLAQQKSSSMSTMLDSVKGTSDIAKFSESIYSGISDMCSISAVSASLNSLSKTVQGAGIGDIMPNVRAFAEQLQKEGTDTLSILQYLNRAREMAKKDPAYLAEIFTAEAETGETAANLDGETTDATAATENSTE
jgi:DNA repair ATPase RecN